ncbi:hypothetical protein C8Q76DRAFT_786972 [Earliella scabrosa]|nr:hypothetical protein C8Q76DRAFT_786972 [Earliella scabrosa]
MAVDQTLGAGFVGSLVASCLYGVTCLQTFIYFQQYASDHIRLKLIVSILLALDTAHIVIVGHTMYWYVITNFTNPSIVQEIPWSLCAGILIKTTSDSIVRSFFTYRVWILSKHNRPLCVPLAILAFLVWIIGMVFGIKGFTVPTFQEADKFSWILYLQLGLVVLDDVSIATSLCLFLYRAGTGLNRRTDTMIHILMRYTINTGLLTSFVISLCLITYAALPRTLVYLSFYFNASKMYLNALLATLNARDKIRTHELDGTLTLPRFLRHDETTTTAIPLSEIRRTSNTVSNVDVMLSLELGHHPRTRTLGAI